MSIIIIYFYIYRPNIKNQVCSWLYLGFHVHEVQSLCVDPDIHTDDFVVAGAGLGVNLTREESCSVGWDVPAVLQEESLEMVHLFAHSLARAQGLFTREGQTSLESPQGAVWFYLRNSNRNTSILCIREESCWSSGKLCFSLLILVLLISGFPHCWNKTK